MRSCAYLGILLLSYLAACHAGRPARGVAATGQAPPAKASTATEAVALVTAYVSQFPGHEVYLFNQAEVAATTCGKSPCWEVFVPRADRVNFKPSGSAFRVNKASGNVEVVPLK